jgi:catechol 2,3-dioxygenase-like lactoylglutathione lyase family enzyme
MQLEVLVIPVTDVDRAKAFYAALGWRLDADRAGDEFRLVQITPPGAVAERFASEFVTSQRALDRQPFLHAVARGELASGAAIELAIDQLAGPVYYRVLITGEPVTPDYADALVDRFLAAAEGAA